MSDDPRERQVVFGVAPSKDGRIRVFFVITNGSWAAMRNWRSSDFDLTRMGLPLRAMMTRCETRGQGLDFLRSHGLLVAAPLKEVDRLSDKIVFGLGMPKDGQPSATALMLVPAAAYRSMVNHQVVQRLDMSSMGLKLVLHVAAVGGGYSDGMAWVQEQMASEGHSTYVDATNVDWSISKDPQTMH